MCICFIYSRYIYVCMPLRAVCLMKPHTRYCCTSALIILSCIYNLPRFFDSCIMTFVDICTDTVILTQKVYSPTFNKTLYFDIYIYTTYIILLYVGPLVTLMVLNTRLIRMIRRSARRQRSFGAQNEHSDSNATLVLVIVVIVFIICNTPELILKFLACLDRIFNQINLPPILLAELATVTEFLMVINASANFFIYFAFGRRFRMVMKQTFRYISTTSTPLTAEIIPLRMNIGRTLLKPKQRWDDPYN